MYKRILSVIVSLAVLLGIVSPMGEISKAYAASEKLERALQWAIAIANDNSHGYSQSNRWGNPDYDCSSFVISALKAAGYDVGGATFTQNMRSALTPRGFTWIPWSQIGGAGNLRRGDILLNDSTNTSKQHTEFYLGNNQNVGAHQNYGYPAPGDQTGREISVSGYYDHPWTGVLRENGASVDTCNCTTAYAGNYIVTTSQYPLTMRSGHGTSFSQVTTIPKGAQVYVSKADGSWAHVEWNGYKGYCSMQYLTKVEEKPKPQVSLHAWVSDSKMGDVPQSYQSGKMYYLCYEVLDASTGKRLDDSRVNYQMKETIYAPDGSVANTCTYSNSNNNWIGFQTRNGGEYRGVVEISGDYSGKCEVSYTIPDLTSPDIFFCTSGSKYGDELYSFKQGNFVFFYYKMYDGVTGQAWDGLSENAYKIEATIYKPDGSVLVSQEFSKDKGCFSAQVWDTGQYTFQLQVSGDFNAEGTESFQVEKQTAAGLYYGDLNGDGEIDVLDVAIMRDGINGTREFTDDVFKRADLNVDGKLTEEDSQLLRQFVVGSITEFPAERLISELVITKEPDKLSYQVGESLSMAGMEVTVFYGNGTSKKVTDYKVSGSTAKAGRQQVEISYTESGVTRTAVQEIEVVAPHRHIYLGFVWKEATCQEEGEVCNQCDCGDRYLEKIPKKEHKVVTDRAKDPTCTQPGKTEGSHCSRCGTVLVEQQEIPQTGHKNKEIRGQKEPTCTEDGYTGDTYCLDCGEKLAAGKRTSKQGHRWNAGVVTKEATLTQTGIKTYICQNCGATRQEVLPVLEKEPGKNPEKPGGSDLVQKPDIPETDKPAQKPDTPGKLEEDRFLEVGDIVFDAGKKGEYEVIFAKTKEIRVQYLGPVKNKTATVKIPDKIKTKAGHICKVTAIAQNAFRNNKYLKKVVVGANVTAIGSRVFYNCKNLSSVQLGKRVASIASNAFGKCGKLKKLLLPASVVKIDSNAFYGCKQLKSLQVKSAKLRSGKLGRKAFAGIAPKALIKVPASKRKSYQKLFRQKGMPPRASVRAY